MCINPPVKTRTCSKYKKEILEYRRELQLCCKYTFRPKVQKVWLATCNQAVQRMTTELAATIQTQQTGDVSSPKQAEELQLEHREPTNIWSMIDERVAASISTRPPTSNSIVTLRTNLEQPNIKRIENPLMWWKNNTTIFPFFSKFAKKT